MHFFLFKCCGYPSMHHFLHESITENLFFANTIINILTFHNVIFFFKRVQSENIRKLGLLGFKTTNIY